MWHLKTNHIYSGRYRSLAIRSAPWSLPNFIQRCFNLFFLSCCVSIKFELSSSFGFDRSTDQCYTFALTNWNAWLRGREIHKFMTQNEEKTDTIVLLSDLLKVFFSGGDWWQRDGIKSQCWISLKCPTRCFARQKIKEPKKEETTSFVRACVSCLSPFSFQFTNSQRSFHSKLLRIFSCM